MSKKIKPIQQRSYLALHAAVCPMCKSPNIESENIDADGEWGTANCSCCVCGSQWTDIWRVTSFHNLNEGMSDAELKQVEQKAAVVRALNK